MSTNIKTEDITTAVYPNTSDREGVKEKVKKKREFLATYIDSYVRQEVKKALIKQKVNDRKYSKN